MYQWIVAFQAHPNWSKCIFAIMVYPAAGVGKWYSQLLFSIWQWCDTEVWGAQLDEEYVAYSRILERDGWADALFEGLDVLLGSRIYSQSQEVWLHEAVESRNWYGNTRGLARQKQIGFQTNGTITKFGCIHLKVQPFQDSNKQLHFHRYGRSERSIVPPKCWNRTNAHQWFRIYDKWNSQVVWILSKPWFRNKRGTRKLSFQYLLEGERYHGQ